MKLQIGYPTLIDSSWASGDSDGCIDAVEGLPQCTAILIADDDGAGTGYFAVLTSVADNLKNYFFVQPNDGPIDLAPIPGPNLLEQSGDRLVFEPPTLSAEAFYLDDACHLVDPEELVVGYRVYQQFVDPGGAAPIDRDRESPTSEWRVAFGGEQANGAPLPIASSADLLLACPGPQDVYFSIALVLEGGFETGHVSAQIGPFPCACTGVDADHDGYCIEAGPFQDCDDADERTFPGAADGLCDGVNLDCADPNWPDPPENEADRDTDGWAVCAGDCDDANAAVFPGAGQVCDGLNNDCRDPFWPEPPSNDADRDSDGWTECAGDCLDSNPTVFPDAPQVCGDFRNNDCSHPSWPDVTGTNEDDLDGDGWSECLGDCDETDTRQYPGAPQICGDGLNNDCNHPSWPSLENTNERDDDGDFLSECQGDCADFDAEVFPGAPEICDGVNNDCLSAIWPTPPDEDLDADGDGLTSC